eukprot:TRINITY_DN17690_c0_g2_i1.p1 TRINITY_DN17690_c0_g2~~TRINITY_DN17690_c0_g2_i1.p1  ORF type:complete len:451 (+),score=37.66 TRINITY_DN17690_c0_g2_i1:84-1355(+)
MPQAPVYVVQPQPDLRPRFGSTPSEPAALVPVLNPGLRKLKAVAHGVTAAHRLAHHPETRRSYSKDRCVDADVIEEIDLDLPRTVADDPLVQARVGRIRALLLQHVAEDPELGYCQGMSLVAAVFATGSLTQGEAYSRFRAFTLRVRGLWLPGFPLLEAGTAHFETLAQNEKWYRHMCAHSVDTSMYMPQALLTMFAMWLPLATLLSCVQLLEHHGFSGMLAMALAIAGHCGEVLCHRRSFEDLLFVLKDLKAWAPNQHELLAATRLWLPRTCAVSSVPAPVGRCRAWSRSGSSVVDEEGKSALEDAPSAISWLKGETSTTQILSWAENEAAVAGGALLRWALSMTPDAHLELADLASTAGRAGVSKPTRSPLQASPSGFVSRRATEPGGACKRHSSQLQPVQSGYGYPRVISDSERRRSVHL